MAKQVEKTDDEKVVVKIVTEKGVNVPIYAHNGDAGVDLVSNAFAPPQVKNMTPERGIVKGYTDGIKIKPLQRVLIPTGVYVSIPKGYVGYLYSRSGLSSKNGLLLTNGVGVIDSTYTGEILVPLTNVSGMEQTIKAGDKIAQLIIQKIPNIEFKKVKKLTKTKRGDGGFGSSDNK